MLQESLYNTEAKLSELQDQYYALKRTYDRIKDEFARESMKSSSIKSA
jgi:hypothetical protein